MPYSNPPSTEKPPGPIPGLASEAARWHCEIESEFRTLEIDYGMM